MKNYLLIALVFIPLLFGCGGSGITPENYYIDCKAEVVDKYISGGEKIVIIRLIENPKKYRELSDHDCCNDIVTEVKYYQWQIGDVLYFDYLDKNKFFSLEREYQREYRIED